MATPARSPVPGRAGDAEPASSPPGPVPRRDRPRRFGPSALATPANAVSAGRLALTVPFLLLVAADGASAFAVTAWIVLGLTDWVDGWLARRDGSTRSGAFLDPLADKALTVGGFVALAVQGVYGWVPVALVAGREVAVSAYRAVLGRRGVTVPARMLGKVKTNVQLVAVGFALLPPTAEVDWLLQATLWLAVVFTVVSGLEIARRGARAS